LREFLSGFVFEEDQSFGTGGKVSSNFSNREEAYALALQRDGKIVVAGLSDPSGNTFDFTLARYFAVNRKRSSPR
jgi:hypothetical protein